MKMPNSYGSVYKLSGRRRRPWAVRKTVGWKQVPDRMKSYPVYEFIGYYATKTEALQALAEYNKDPYDLRTAATTFSEVYERWSAEHFPKIKDATHYKLAYKDCKPLWDMRFADIKLDHMQKALDESGKNAPGLGFMKTLLHALFHYAIIHEIVTPDRDMTKYLDTSKTGNPKAQDRQPFSASEIDTLWKESGDRTASVILILIYTGVRIGELLELEKQDVHLEERWFYVKESKTAAGVREVPIAEKVVPFFEYWLAQDGDKFLSFGGKPVQYLNFFTNYWKPLMRRLGMEHTPHCTRHTCISLLVSAGADERIVQQIVGHRGSNVTQIIYTHVDLPAKLKAINLI